MNSVPIVCSGCSVRWRAPTNCSPRFEPCPHCGTLLAIPPGLESEPPDKRVDCSDPVIEQVLGRDKRRNTSQFGSLVVMGSILFASAIAWFVFASVAGWSNRFSVSTSSSRDPIAVAMDPAPSLISKPSSSPVLPRPPKTRATPSIDSPDESEPVKLVDRLEVSAASESVEGTDAAEGARGAADRESAASELTCSTESREPDKPAESNRVAASPAAALDMPVGRNFKNMPIQDVVAYLTETTGVTFQLDMKSLWFDQGTTKNMPVTIESEKLTIREFLDQVVTKQMKAVYQVRDDRIVIVSRKAANKSASGTP